MKIKLSANTIENIIYKNLYPENFDGKKDIDEVQVEIETASASINLHEKWFNGIHISIVEINPRQPEDFFFESTQQHIGFLFCLEGSLDYYYENSTHFLSLLKNEQNINLGMVGRISFKVTEKTKYVYIQLTKAYYYTITSREFNNEILTGAKEPIALEVNLILQQIVNQSYAGRVKRLFLEARIFDLLVFYLTKEPYKPLLVLKEEDVNKIIYAKQLVELDLQKPNSLIELSRKAGINDYKLKKGFKELTGHTVFGYLYKIRMEKAHYFLSKEKKTVNEVAFLVGYKNAQHFIAAFKKQYQVLPGSLNKN